MDFTRIQEYGKRILATAAFIGLAACVSTTLAKRDYDKYPTRRGEIALYNIDHILGNMCCNRLGDDYPDCYYFEANDQRFSCRQVTMEGEIISTFSWDEIEEVTCKGRKVEIKGKFDSSVIYAKGRDQLARQQCQDLAEAINIYLEGK